MSRYYRKKKKQNTGTVMVVIVLIMLLIVAGGIYYIISSGRPSKERIDPEEYFGWPGDGQAAVATTLGLCESMGVKTAEDRIFISCEEIRDVTGGRLYYDAGSQTVTIPTPSEIINLSPTDGEDTDKIVVSQGELMIASDFLEECMDVEIRSFTVPDRVVIRCAWDTPVADAVEDSVLRMEPSIKSPIVTDIAAGEQVCVLEAGDAFYKVSTDDGFTGYVSVSQMGPVEEAPAHENPALTYTHNLLDEKVILGFHQTDTAAANAALSYVTQDAKGMNVIAPTWYFLDSTDGAFTDLSDAEYVSGAHEKGLQVWAVINDFDGKLNSGTETAEALSGTPVRQELERKIIESAVAAGIDGINLDFENVSKEGIDAFLIFLREMSVLCRQNGLVLSSDMYVPEPYNLYLQPAAQAEAADYLLIMAYDEHHRGSEESGSVSSIAWVEKAVEGGIEAVGSADRVIIAIPFYTRLWETSENGTVTCSSLGMTEAAEYVKEHSMKVTWDDSVKQNYAVQGSSPKYEIWMEDEQSMTAKLRVISAAGTSVGAWKLGLEDSSVWNLITSYISPAS
ncbi:MAG: SH3 domain-containing protein [Lachnospiraceae bacterium]|nr:SH3 domain-containing protein [Lachnospiraceae bacterium]